MLLFALNTTLFGKDKDDGTGIVLVAIGKVDKGIIESLKTDLNKIFNRRIMIGKGMEEPDYAFNKKRNQYLSSAILDTLLEQKEYAPYEKILAMIDHDLYVPELNFVFGVATNRGAIISITRLRQEFYGLPKDKSLFKKRTFTEAVHELGHTYGLGHCNHLHCVMFFSNTLMDTDRKGPKFCEKCKKNLSKALQ